MRDNAPCPQDFKRRWRARFEEFAAQHEDDASIAGWSTSGLATRLRQFARLWPGDRRGARWLDAGCGAGTYTRFLAEAGIESIGIDYSFPAVMKAKARSQGQSGWVVGDVHHLPLRPGTLDGVLCFGVTQALAESERVIREIAITVRPGGRVWVDGLNSYCLPHLWDRFYRRVRGRTLHVRYESPWRIARLLREHDVQHVCIHWLPIVPQRLQVIQGALESLWMRAFIRAFPPLSALLCHAFLVSGVRAEGEVAVGTI
jgi:SAM-dependent methyltransferase